jgi:NAD(P)-dependent dehydrogenase (short-subunit alcohol dehydrogenase family)
MIALRQGTVLFVSSSFVTDPPKNLGHYAAAKSAAETLLRASARHSRAIRFLAMRPPRLLTDMTDTPSGKLDAIPPTAVLDIVLKIAQRHPLPVLASSPIEVIHLQ